MLHMLIVDDRRLFREAIASRLVSEEGIELVAMLGHQEVYEKRLPLNDVSFVVLGREIATTREIIRRIRSVEPAPHVIAGAIEADDSEIVDCIEAGAIGYVAHDASYAQFVQTIWDVSRGRPQCGTHVMAGVIRRIQELSESPFSNGSPNLTPRETEVAKLVAHGWANKQIARELGIKLSTVKNHMHNILGKLDLRNRAELMGCPFEARTRGN